VQLPLDQTQYSSTRSPGQSPMMGSDLSLGSTPSVSSPFLVDRECSQMPLQNLTPYTLPRFSFASPAPRHSPPRRAEGSSVESPSSSPPISPASKRQRNSDGGSEGDSEGGETNGEREGAHEEQEDGRNKRKDEQGEALGETASQRNKKVLLERARRQELTQQFTELQNCVPSLRSSIFRPTKATLLQSACRYIRKLETQIAQLSAQNQYLTNNMQYYNSWGPPMIFAGQPHPMLPPTMGLPSQRPPPPPPQSQLQPPPPPQSQLQPPPQLLQSQPAPPSAPMPSQSYDTFYPRDHY